jgi:hypothetical protein
MNQTKPNKTKSRQLEEPKRTKPNEPSQPKTNMDEQPINETQIQRNTRRLKEQTNPQTEK